MRILLAQNMYYAPSHGGANKSNRMIVERLAQRGHECHVVAPLTGRLPHVPVDEMPDYLAARGGEVLERTDRTLVYRYAGVTVHGVLRGSDLVRTITGVLGEADFDWALVPSDDPGMLVLSSVQRRTDRIVYFVHTLQQLPFGERSFRVSAAATAMIGKVAGLVSVSEAARDYVLRWAGLESELIYPDVYTATPARAPEPSRQRYATLINACTYKGIDILLGLADALPGQEFLAVESWGTTERDLGELAARPNITVRPSVDDVEEIYGQTKVLMMPSLWDETFGYACVEAMLRGIPVLAADVAGLREAKLGVDHLLPVRPIPAYGRSTPLALPSAQPPAQDLAPWRSALQQLTGDPEHHRKVSEQSRTAAENFVAGLDPDAVERYLVSLNTGTGALR